MDVTDALTLLQERLQTRFTNDYADELAAFKGVRVITRDSSEVRPVKLYIELSVDDTNTSEWSSADQEWLDVTVRAEIHAGDTVGARAKPRPADSVISKALREIIKADRSYFWDSGLYVIALAGMRERDPARRSGPGHIDEHRITFKIKES